MKGVYMAYVGSYSYTGKAKGITGYYDESGIDGVEEAIYRVKIENGYEIRICEELTESLISRGATGLELHREKPDI